MNRTAPLAAIALALTLLVSGCAATGSATADPTAPGAASQAATRTIVDHTGNEVTIPATITAVAVDEIPIASTYVAYFDGAAPHLVGMSDAVVQSLTNTVVADMAPEILDVETGYYADGDLNIESLLAIRPDVVFYNANNTEHAAMFAAAGIPAVGFSTSGDPTTVYADWLRLLEQVFNEPGKMDALIEHGTELVADVKERTSAVTERQSALIIFNYAKGTLRVAGETPFFGSFWLETINADNAAVGADGGLAAVTAEQVYAWQPDVVLVGGSGQARITPKQILTNTVDGLDLTPLTAVANGHVASNDLGMWSWFTPNPDAPLVATWLGKTVYPDTFTDVDLVELTRDYYQRAYSYELSADQAADILEGASGNE